MIKEKAGDPEASVNMHNLKRIDASRGWLGVVLRITDFGRAPYLDKIVLASLYDVISGPAGQRDWDRFRALFVPDGRIVSIHPESAATKDAPAGKGDAVFLTPDMFAQQNDSYFKAHGFFERSIANRVEEFGKASCLYGLART